MEQWVSVLYK